MKKIFSLILILISINSLAQFPSTQSMATATTKLQVNGGLDAVKGLINGVYTDTASANAGNIDFYNGAQIWTSSDRNFWLRSTALSAWIRMAKYTDVAFTLNQVAHNGNITDTLIIADAFNVTRGVISYAELAIGSFAGHLHGALNLRSPNGGGNIASLYPALSYTTNRTHVLPDYSGTVAIHPTIVGQAGKVLAVNGGETALEWITAGGGGTNIYNTDDSFTGDRIATLGERQLTFPFGGGSNPNYFRMHGGGGVIENASFAFHLENATADRYVSWEAFNDGYTLSHIYDDIKNSFTINNGGINIEAYNASDYALVSLNPTGGEVGLMANKIRFEVLGESTAAGYVWTDVLGDGYGSWQPAGGGGGGTVTSVSIVDANGFSGSVANPTTTPAITLSINSPSFETWYQYYMDAIGGSNVNFYIASAGTGSSVSVPSTPIADGWIGGIQFSTGTTSSGLAYSHLASFGTWKPVAISNSFRYNFGGNIRLEDLSDGTETYEMILGFADNGSTSSIVDGVYFTYTHSASSGQFVCHTESNNTLTSTASGVTVAADTDYNLEVSVYNGNAFFYINKVLVATNTTNIPTGTARATSGVFVINKLAGTTARLAYSEKLAYGKKSN